MLPGMQEPGDYGHFDTAMLLSHIAQLERERDELRSNVEQVSILQTGIFGGLDLVSRIQGRRTSGSEQELEVCEQKLNACRKENIKLQEELSEVYIIKSKFAELLKIEVEKSVGLEKEVKFFQLQAAAALADRDRSLVEIERLQRKKDGLIEKITDLQEKLDNLTLEYTEEKRLSEGLYIKLEKAKEENDLYKKEKCAKLEGKDALSFYHQRLLCLTERVHTELHQLVAFKGSLKENVSRCLMEEKNWVQSLQEALQHLTSKGPAQCFEFDDFNHMDETTYDLVQHYEEMSKSDSQFSCSRATSEDGGSPYRNKVSMMDNQMGGLEKCEQIAVRVHQTRISLAEEFASGTQKEEHLVDEVVSREGVSSSGDTLFTDDGKALAQALQEKVSALLLLSQQEERHLLESNTTFALESQLSALKQQLLQVTNEKMNALMELAGAQEKCLKLQEQEKIYKKSLQQKWMFSGGAVAEHDISSNNENIVSFASKKAAVHGYFKHLWPRAKDQTKSLSSMLSLNRSKEDDAEGIARLRVENMSLRESLSSIGHLCKSVNRLRLTIARIAVQSDAQLESVAAAAVEEVEGVILEALHLKVALNNSSHYNELGWDSIGCPLLEASDLASSQEGLDVETKDEEANSMTSFGLEIVRLVLLSAQLQKRLLAGLSLQT